MERVELLGNRVSAAVSEAKIVGSKLIFKGVFHITVLYRTSSSLCCSSSAELPFSQIMEVEGAAEDHTADVQIQLTGTDLQLDSDDDEGRQIAVTLYFHATALLRQEQELTLLGDLYSTAYDMSYEAVPVEPDRVYGDHDPAADGAGGIGNRCRGRICSDGIRLLRRRAGQSGRGECDIAHRRHGSGSLPG